MAIKIRQSKNKYCEACSSKQNVNEGVYDIFIGKGNTGNIHSLCVSCMHELLQKMIVVGRRHNEIC